MSLGLWRDVARLIRNHVDVKGCCVKDEAFHDFRV